jgi:hypothetical protein
MKERQTQKYLETGDEEDKEDFQRSEENSLGQAGL